MNENERIKIEDNFLNQSEFHSIQEIMMGSAFPWFYSDGIVTAVDGKFQFTHLFYQDSYQFCQHSGPQSENLKMLMPVINALPILTAWRIKANLLTRTSTIVENEFHTDIGTLVKKPEKLAQWTTSILYINTNNGYTKFEDGTKVESVANRLLTFPANMKHAGTSCTNERVRVVINFNYFKLHQ